MAGTNLAQLRQAKAMRILLSAYACEPGSGSEPGVGWNWVRQIERFHEVWVITRANNRERIEAELKDLSMPHARWVYVDLPYWLRFWKRGRKGMRLYYYLWQIAAYSVGHQLHKSVKFDLVHHLTFGTYWMPTYLAYLDVPFVWGPVGGGEATPKSFYRTFSARGRMYESLRAVAKEIFAHDPFLLGLLRRANVCLCKTVETAKRLERLGAKRIEVLPESAILEEEFPLLGSFPLHNSSPFRLVSIGRLLHWKGFHLGLEAFAKIQQKVPASVYWLFGDGPERNNLERLAGRLRVSDKIRFFGALPRKQVLENLGKCDVLVHPSLHDSGGWVCLEAMAAGRPVICLDLGGPALQVTDQTGFKIKVSSPEQVVSDLSQAMQMLAADRELLLRMGRAGQERVKEHFNWDKKGERIRDLYNEILCRPRTEEIKSRCTLE